MDYKKAFLDFLASHSIEPVNGEIIKRDDLKEFLISEFGYAERTALNHLYASRDGSFVNQLTKHGVIESGGVKRWRIKSIDALDEMMGQHERRQSKTPTRYFWGNENKGEGWRTMDGIAEVDEVPQWSASYKRLDGDREAYNVKLFAEGRAEAKANYWLFYSGGKLTGRDSETLKSHRPHLYENLLEDMKMAFG